VRYTLTGPRRLARLLEAGNCRFCLFEAHNVFGGPSTKQDAVEWRVRIMSSTSEMPEINVLRKRLLEQQPQSEPLLNRLIRRLDGKKNHIGAFAAIKERRCSGCHMTVASVRLQKAKSGEFVSCAGCSRFLYIESH